MELDEIIREWAEDAKIDPLQPGLASIRTASIHAKWLGYLSEERRKLKRMRLALTQHKNVLRSYYKGEMDKDQLANLKREPFRKKLLKADVDQEVDADPDVINTQVKIIDQDEKVEALQEIMKQLTARQFQISKFIKWRALAGGDSYAK